VNPQCIIIDENELVEGLTYDTIRKTLVKHNSNQRVGWYFQQFLKMGFALSKYVENDYYLSWDSDTLPLKPIEMFDYDEHPFFTMKSEYHQPYFNSLNRLLGIGKTNKKSYIAEHMLFNKNIMKELLYTIEKSNISGERWYEKIINSMDFNEPCGFSEFETYGTFCLHNYPSLYRERELSCFRYGGFIQGRLISRKVLEKLSFDISIVTFEPYHNPPFPWGLLNHIYYKYLKKKERIIEKFLI
jgi:hypothetical protein